MRAVVQRVSRAKVEVEGQIAGEIGKGLLVLLGVAKTDLEADATFLVNKITELRIFSDENGKMNRSLLDFGGGLLVVSQFTLQGECRKGRRPDFSAAAPPEMARALYEHFVGLAKQTGLPVATGVFQADMQVELVNDGPVTFIVDSPNRS